MTSAFEKQHIAVELAEKLIETMRKANEDKRLMIPVKLFAGSNQMAGVDPDE